MKRKIVIILEEGKDRLNAVLLRQEGKTYAEIAKIFGVHVDTAREWIMRYEKEGSESLVRERRHHKRHVSLDRREIEKALRFPNLTPKNAKKLRMLMQLCDSNTIAEAAKNAGVSQQYLCKVRRDWNENPEYFFMGKIVSQPLNQLSVAELENALNSANLKRKDAKKLLILIDLATSSGLSEASKKAGVSQQYICKLRRDWNEGKILR